jgi:vacuolar protein 8
MKEVLKDQLPSGLNIPIDFQCPLSLELMSDPVIVASGQTYERTCIQKWIDQGNTRCPKTFQTLSHKNLIPNYTVKALIANWCEANHVPPAVPLRLESVVSTQQQPLTSPGISKTEPDFNDESTSHDLDLSSRLADRAKEEPRVLPNNFRKSSGSGEFERVNPTWEHCKSGNLSSELDRSVSRSPRVGFSEEPRSPALPLEKMIFRRRGEERDASLPCIVPDTSGIKGNVQQLVNGLVEDL